MISKLLLLVSLFFWAWQTQTLWLGIIFSLLLLSVMLMPKKFNVDAVSCHHIGDLCLLIALGIFTFYWLDSKATKAIFPTLQMLPIALFPLLLVQFLHEKQRVPSSALLFMQRKLRVLLWIDLIPLFVVLCLFSAGAVQSSNVWYFPSLVVILFVLMLLQRRSESLGKKIWVILLFFVAAGVAFVGQLLLVDLQNRFEASINQWLLNQHNYSQTSTAIGGVGRLKLSDDIIFRVERLGKATMPLLLQTGSYQRYVNEQWFAGSWAGQDVPFDGDIWQFREKFGQTMRLRFFQDFDKNDETLALPLHAYAVRQMPADTMKIKQGGSVVIQPTQPFAVFEVDVDSEGDLLTETNQNDLQIADNEAKTIAHIAKTLNLYQIRFHEGEKAVLEALNHYFWQKYTYSPWLETGSNVQSPLSDFLINTHAGHCEYFATATVLLLREVGIPARYAVGYSMQEEYSNGLYLIRGRDAHAWALAFIDGQWVNVDNTPPNWFVLENEDRHTLQDLKDMWSSLLLAVNKWRYTHSTDNTSLWLSVLLVLFSFLAWRILRRVKVEKLDTDDLQYQYKQLEDSSWFLLEQALIDAGFKRFSGETLKAWLKRIEKEELFPLVDLHYQLRFHAQGLDKQQVIMLNSAVEAYREQLNKVLRHNQSYLVNQRAKMTPLRVKTASNIDPSI